MCYFSSDFCGLILLRFHSFGVSLRNVFHNDFVFAYFSEKFLFHCWNFLNLQYTSNCIFAANLCFLEGIALTVTKLNFNKSTKVVYDHSTWAKDEMLLIISFIDFFPNAHNQNLIILLISASPEQMFLVDFLLLVHW